MPTPSPRNSIRIARGQYADLLASVSNIGEGELCFATDQDKFYSKSSGSLIEVGKGTALYTINQLGDVDVSTAAPGNGDFLQWNGTNWVPGSSSGAPVDSVNGQTGIVVLNADDISDAATTNKYTTAADISKLAGIAAGAEVNVNADWNAVSGDAQILNKPTLGTAAAADTTDFATAAQGATADSALQSADIGVTVQGYDANTAKLNAVQTFTAVQTLTDPVIVGTIAENVYTIVDDVAFEVDPGNGSVQLVTLGANRTPKATNFAAGEAVTLMVADGTAYTLTWTDTTWGPGGVVWTGGSAPTLATSGYTVIQFWKVGSQVYGATVGDVA